ncbi:MAG: SHOCT domain-containing protein [Bacillota bacterium]
MMGFGPGIMGGGFSIIFWIVIIGVVYYFFKEYNNRNKHRHDNHKHGGLSNKKRDLFDDNNREIDHRVDENSPEELARQRYAKGEISKEELNKILDNLNN